MLLSVNFQENITALFIKCRLGQIIISCWRWVQRMRCQVSTWISKFGPFFPWCNTLICYMGILKCEITHNTGFYPYGRIWVPLPYVCYFNQNNLIINFLGFLQCSWADQKLLLHCCVLLLIANVIFRYYIINMVIFCRTVWNTNTTPKTKSALVHALNVFFNQKPCSKHACSISSAYGKSKIYDRAVKVGSNISANKYLREVMLLRIVTFVPLKGIW